MINQQPGGKIVRFPGPSAPAEPVLEPAEPGKMPVVSIRLGPGERLRIDPPEPPPSDPKEDFDFLGANFYLASRELSERLPHLGLTATDYDVWHTMLGKQAKGGIVPLTKTGVGKILGIHRNQSSKALERLMALGLIWEHKRGEFRINPRIAFWGGSAEQRKAIESIPDYVPQLVLPTTTVRPRRRTTKDKEGS